jgi:LysM repeat protein
MIIKRRIQAGMICAMLLWVCSVTTLYSQTIKATAAEYIATYKDAAMVEMQLYKIPASIILAQGVLETNSGNSELAINANNHFGIKCKEEWTGEKYYYDDDAKNECFRKYKSAWDSYRDHSLFLTTRDRYATLFQLEITDYKGWAKGLKQAGYATEPAYAEMLIKIIEENKLYEFDLNINFTVVSVVKDTSGQAITNHAETADFQDIILSDNSRRIGQINGVRYIQARAGDNYNAIAEDFGLTAKDIAVYNDLKKDHVPATSEVVYIESKKDDGPVGFHKVTAGETMHGISQHYGIKLQSLYRKNHMKQGTEAAAGQKLYLQNSATVDDASSKKSSQLH